MTELGPENRPMFDQNAQKKDRLGQAMHRGQNGQPKFILNLSRGSKLIYVKTQKFGKVCLGGLYL